MTDNCFWTRVGISLIWTVSGRQQDLCPLTKKDYDVLCDIRKQLRALEMDDAEKERRMDSLRYQIDELERAELVPGEEEELNAGESCFATVKSIFPRCPERITA